MWQNSFEAIQNFPALVFTISRGDAADSSYNQSDYGSSVWSQTSTATKLCNMFQYIVAASILMDAIRLAFSSPQPLQCSVPEKSDHK